jgi:hypothetical protein
MLCFVEDKMIEDIMKTKEKAQELILVCVPPQQQQDTNNSNSVPSCSTKQYIEHDDAGNSKMMIAGAGD